MSAHAKWLKIELSITNKLQDELGVMRPFACSVFALCLLLVYVDGQFSPTGQPVHVNDGNFSDRYLTKLEPSQHRAPLHPWSGSCEPLHNSIPQLEMRYCYIIYCYIKLITQIYFILFFFLVMGSPTGRFMINGGSICQFLLHHHPHGSHL